MSARPSCGDLSDEIESMADHMRSVAARMEYLGGFNQEILDHARALEGASRQARTWAKGMRTSRMAAEFTRPGGLYRCSLCGRKYWRETQAGWINSTCVLTGRKARLTRMREPQ